MVSLPTVKPGDSEDPKKSGGSCGTGGGCGTSCGSGLEKVYPTTAVRFGAMRWIGEFQYRPGTVFKCGAKVIIETDRGTEVGEQVSLTCNGCDKSVSREQIRRYVETSGPEFYELKAGRILREATPQDITDHDHLNAHIQEDIDRCALLAMQMELDLKIVTVEHLFGGERIVFYFRSEDRIDFRSLVRELASHYRTRIEMRQVGARDEARLVADYEVCGRECCCKNFLKKLRPVNMRMAKLQKSTLDPSKVSGRCGRLRCCLRYEHEAYESLNAKLPRTGARVNTKMGPATVIDRQILTQLLLVKTDEGQDMAVPIEDLLDVDLAPTAFTRVDDDDAHVHEGGGEHGGDGGSAERGGPRGDRRDDRRPRPDGRRPDGARPERGGGERSGDAPRTQREERPARDGRGAERGPRDRDRGRGPRDERQPDNRGERQGPRPQRGGTDAPTDAGAQMPDAASTEETRNVGGEGAPSRGPSAEFRGPSEGNSGAAEGRFTADDEAGTDEVPGGDGGGAEQRGANQEGAGAGGRSRRRRRRRRGGTRPEGGAQDESRSADDGPRPDGGAPPASGPNDGPSAGG